MIDIVGIHPGIKLASSCDGLLAHDNWGWHKLKSFPVQFIWATYLEFQRTGKFLRALLQL